MHEIQVKSIELKRNSVALDSNRRGVVVVLLLLVIVRLPLDGWNVVGVFFVGFFFASRASATMRVVFADHPFEVHQGRKIRFGESSWPESVISHSQSAGGMATTTRRRPPAVTRCFSASTQTANHDGDYHEPWYCY